MIQTSIARRYARALFETVGPAFERAGAEMKAIADAMAGDSPLARLFSDPSASRQDRRSVLEGIIEKAGLDPLVGNFLRILDDRNRLLELPSISEAFAALVDEKAGRIRATILSAEPLPPEVIAKLQQALSRATEKTVEIETALDRSLLGGVVAQVGNFVYDGSLRTQLSRLRRDLVGQV